MMAMGIGETIQSWNLDWGSTADWVSGLATTTAVVFAFYGLRNERKRNKELKEQISEEQELRDYAAKSLQANQVSAWHDHETGELCIKNNSGAPVYDAYAVLADGTRASSGPPRTWGQTRLLQVVPPETTIRINGITGQGLGYVESYDLTFRDARGVTWFRSNWGKLTEQKEDVFKRYGLTKPYPYYKRPAQVH